MREIKVRQRWFTIKGFWAFCNRNVVVVSISGNTVVVFNEETLRKSTLKKETLNERFLYESMIPKSVFKSLLKRREWNIK